MTGRVVHFEIPFDDGDRARAFYAACFEWKLSEMPELQYTTAMTGPVDEQFRPAEPGFVNGGMFDRSSQEVKRPVITIDVADVDAALDTIERNGGKTVVAKTAVGDMGFAAYFEDSEGNVMGLWQTSS